MILGTGPVGHGKLAVIKIDPSYQRVKTTKILALIYVKNKEFVKWPSTFRFRNSAPSIQRLHHVLEPLNPPL